MIQNNGIHKTYYENGQLESEINYIDEKKTVSANGIMKMDNQNLNQTIKMENTMEYLNHTMKMES